MAGVSKPKLEWQVFLVVPAEKFLRKSPAILNAAETVRELRSIFHGAELTFNLVHQFVPAENFVWPITAPAGPM
jgi:hypothetical protein